MLDSTSVRSTPQIPSHRQPHAVVIGSGFGGLAAAIRLGAKGYRVTVLEKLDAPGGRAYVYRQDGFTFDAGPTIVTAPFLFEELWKLCGRKMSDDVTLVPVSPFYRIRFQDGSHFDYSGDADAMRREIARFSPGDVDGYDAYMKASEEIFKVGFERLGDVPFSRWTDMARIAPEMIRLSSYRSVFSLVSKFFRDERLRVVFSFHPLLDRRQSVHGEFDLLPDRVPGAALGRAFCDGRHRTAGRRSGRADRGAGRQAPLQRGGSRDHREERRRVRRASRLRRDHRRRCRGVQRRLRLDLSASAAVVSTSRWTDRRIERARYSMSLFVWYFGTRRKYADVPHHTILLGPRYKELLTDIFERKVLADDFSLYLHRPTATDTSLAPDGCDAFYVLSPVPHLQSGTDWSVMAEKYRRAIARELGNTMLPDLENQIVSSRMLTPQDFQDRLSSFRGAAFGLEPILTQSAWFRPHNKSEDIANLYLVGAGTHPGAGLPGVLSSARVLDSLVPDAQSVTRLDPVTA